MKKFLTKPKQLPEVAPPLPVCTLESKCTKIGHIFLKNKNKPQFEISWVFHGAYDGDDKTKLWYVLLSSIKFTLHLY